MPLTLEDAEKQLGLLSAEIKSLKDSLSAPKTDSGKEELKAQIESLQKRFDELHQSLTEKDRHAEEGHHCHWCA